MYLVEYLVFYFLHFKNLLDLFPITMLYQIMQQHENGRYIYYLYLFL